ncbi:hypothetical protein SAY86_005782 [Trapa natans]|uniref:Cytochrome b-c1 complex subunit 8 n=1 Tax=Trapa natans TaxID=22666 RepID=A0AAN7QRR4_TRANT|nr:hypothetical protein SAY86_005782 [Trapa natans]
MGKQPVRMKAVVYALSPFQQKIMSGLWKDLPSKIHHKISDNWISATLLLGPLVGTYTALLDTPRLMQPLDNHHTHGAAAAAIMIRKLSKKKGRNDD